jgi:TonB family protein
MFESKSIVPKFDPKPDRPLVSGARSQGSADPKQRRMMVIALTLLLVALGFVLYWDRDFWFPDAEQTQEFETPPTQSAPNNTAPAQDRSAKTAPPAFTSRQRGFATAKASTQESVTAVPSDPPEGAVIQRTVLPALEVEVVAGDVHRVVRPGSNSVRVDLQPPASPQSSPRQTEPDTSTASAPPEPTAALTPAAEHVEMSTDASEIVSRSVRPGYPMLARQMKVQGSVILQALISRDGAIQDLHVMSGPPILAGAAQEAVRQWRFKPHYLGTETVETQAKITVNFTISTN